jgi:hypothetical protein
MDPEADVESTYKVAVGLVVYPVCWFLEGWLIWRLGGGGVLAVFMLSLLPTGFFALSWTQRLDRVRRDTRGLLTVLMDRDLRAHLLERRRAIMAEFQELLRQVPGRVLDGAAP